jgi:hypothetical protein
MTTTWYSKAVRIRKKVNPATIASLAFAALSLAAMAGVQVTLR